MSVIRNCHGATASVGGRLSDIAQVPETDIVDEAKNSGWYCIACAW